jgi:SARP family transcriptional regulator, regulator of embCAB operon
VIVPTARRTPAEIKFGILGPVEIYDEVRLRRIRPNSRLQRSLLVALLVRGGSVVPSTNLVYELWGDDVPRKAANALQAHVTRLRRVLRQSEPVRGPDRITSGLGGYALRVAPAETDAWHFLAMTAEAKRVAGHDPLRAVEVFRAALGLWRGTPTEGEITGVISANKIKQLAEERMAATEALYDACLNANLHDQVVGELEAVCAEHPFRERFYDQLMVALYRCGRQAEALAVYERARGLLVRKLGLEPSPALTQRMQEILAHSPSLRSHADAIELAHLRRLVDELTRKHDRLTRTLDRLLRNQRCAECAVHRGRP